MVASTHIALAVSATLLASELSDFKPDAVSWLAIIIGSLLPDIDAGTATISRPGTIFKRFLPRGFVPYLDFLGMLISKIIHSIFGHRNAVHWPIIGVGISALGVYLGHAWLVWLGWGYLWHILGDFCTASGVPIFGPIYRENIKWSPLKTGSWPEHLIFAGLVAYIGFSGWSYLPESVQSFLLEKTPRVGSFFSR